MDKDQTFPMLVISRQQIADDLNAHLEDDGQPPSVTADDPRLTDEVCAAYALAHGQLLDDHPNDTDMMVFDTDGFDQLREDTLRRIGVTDAVGQCVVLQLKHEERDLEPSVFGPYDRATAEAMVPRLSNNDQAVTAIVLPLGLPLADDFVADEEDNDA